MEKNLRIQNQHWSLAATLHYATKQETQEQQDAKTPVVIICHGFVGNRIGTDRLFVKTARALSEQGYMVLRFDYAGCGESLGEYGNEGIDSMIEQTRLVLDYVLDIDGTDRERVTLLGHSLGGAVAILTAAKDHRVTDLVLWAPVAHPLQDIVSIMGQHVYEEALKTGSADYLGYTFTNVFFESLTRNHPYREAVHFTGDVFLVHGTSDEDIPVDYSFHYQNLFWSRAIGECSKEIIIEANHTFSSFNASTSAINRSVEWLQEKDRKNKNWYGWTI